MSSILLFFCVFFHLFIESLEERMEHFAKRKKICKVPPPPTENVTEESSGTIPHTVMEAEASGWCRYIVRQKLQTVDDVQASKRSRRKLHTEIGSEDSCWCRCKVRQKLYGSRKKMSHHLRLIHAVWEEDNRWYLPEGNTIPCHLWWDHIPGPIW